MDDIDDGVLELEVAGMRREADGVLSVELVDPEGRRLPAWEPGAHIDLWMEDLVRQYSLAGDPADRQRYRIAVLQESESGGGSLFVHETLRPCHLVDVGGPRNHFPLVTADRYVLVAGGIGITPLLPIIRALEERGRQWHLHYGGRTRGSMAFLEELSRYGDKVSVHPFDEKGHLDLTSAFADIRDGDAVYCCGPEPLLAAVEEHAGDWPAGTLHTERFAAKERSDDDLQPFDAILQRSGIRVSVPRDVSLMQALESAGIALPSACQDGVCGSCETTVLGGEPLHRDSLTAPGCTVSLMPCVSRALTPELVLDI